MVVVRRAVFRVSGAVFVSRGGVIIGAFGRVFRRVGLESFVRVSFRAVSFVVI